MKKRIVILLSIIMVFAWIASACKGSGNTPGNTSNTGNAGGGSNTASTKEPAYGVPDPSSEQLGGLTFPLTDSPIELEYFSPLDNKVAASRKSYAELPAFEILKEKTGVSVKFRHPPSGMVNEQFNLMIGSGELADIIYHDWMSYPGGPSSALAEGVIMPLNDLIAKHAPNFQKFLNENPDYRRMVVDDQGKLYMFPFSRWDEWQRYNYGPMLRQDWLDAVGLDVPTTMDEWHKVLTAFKQQDPGGTGKVIPFGAEMTNPSNQVGIFHFMTHWGIAFDFMQIDGKVRYGPYQPEYKEFLSVMNQWYKEGLIDTEFTSTDSNQWRAKMTGHRMGATTAFLSGGFGTLTGLMQKEPKFELVGAPFPLALDGKRYHMWKDTWGVLGSGAALRGNMDEKTAIIAVKWLDTAFSEWGNNLFNFGIEGITYEWVDGLPKYTDTVLNHPELPVSEAISQWTLATSGGRWFNQDGRYFEQMMVTKKQREAADKWMDSDVSRTMPLITPTPDEARRIASIENDILTYVREMAVRFVIGDAPLSEFDNYTQQLKRMGIEEVLGLKQTALDRYNARP